MEFQETKATLLAHPSDTGLAENLARALTGIHHHIHFEIRNALLREPVPLRSAGVIVVIATPILLAAPDFERLNDWLSPAAIHGQVLVVTIGTEIREGFFHRAEVIDASGLGQVDISDRLDRIAQRTIDLAGRYIPRPVMGDEITPSMLEVVETLPLGKRIKSLLRAENITYVGDLVSHTEVELLRTPGFGRKSLDEVKRALADVGLRLYMSPYGWPPADLQEAPADMLSAQRAAQLQQSKGGATFEPAGDHFAMVAEGDADDRAAAMRPMTRQMQAVLLEKARAFTQVAGRLDNQLGWTGIGRAATTLADLLDREPENVPDVLGYLYPTAIELGSFVEFDQQLASGKASYASALDPEVRRPLNDLVRNLAPWLRSFPSVREADDDASRFLVQAGAFNPAFEVVQAADEHALLTKADLDVFRQLRDSATRGAFQGEKAGGRAKRSATNLVIAAVAAFGGFLVNAVSSDFATTSPLVHKVGQFLVHTEKSIEALTADLPQDVRFSITDFITDMPALPSPTPEPTRALAVSVRTARRGDPALDDENAPIPDDFLDRTREMILLGQAPPAHWAPHIAELVFNREQLSDLSPLSGLTALQRLDLEGTQVSDLSPLSGLTALGSLDLRGTQVSDLSPLSGLTALGSLDLRGTQVSDLSPLSGLTALGSLDLRGTQVSDLSPLSGLTALQRLDLEGTQVSDLSPLSGLTALESLNLWETQVSDLSPLSGLTALESLNLWETQVSDLSPLSGLTALESLNLWGTQVSDLSPLSGLTALGSLDLEGTQVSDLAPVARHGSLVVGVESESRAVAMRATLPQGSNVQVRVV